MVLALFPCHIYWIRLLLCRRDYQRGRAIYVTCTSITPDLWPIASHLDATVQGIPDLGRGSESPWIICRPLHILPLRKVLPTSKGGARPIPRPSMFGHTNEFQISRLYRPLDMDYLSDSEDEGDLEAGGVQLQTTSQQQPKSSSANKIPETGAIRLGDVWDEREELFGVGGDSDEED